MDEIKNKLADLKLKLVEGDRNVFHEKILSLAPALVIHTQTGMIVFATPGVCGIFDYLDNELEGRQLEDLMPRSYRERHSKHLQGYNAQPKQRTMGEHGMILKGLKKSGEEFDLKISLYPFVVDTDLFTLAFVIEI